MKKLFISVLALAGLAACYNENVVSESSSLAPITFGDVFVEKATRADDPSTTTNTINGFYVWAVMDRQDGTVFADEYIYKSGDAWTYDQTATWAPGHTYYFAALAAERDEDATEFTNLDIDFASDIDGMTPAGLGTIAFTNTDGTDDILYAEYEYTTDNPMNSAPEAVKFQFHHLLSKIKFTFINGFENENDTVVVTNVKIEVPEVGTIDLTQDSYTWAAGTEKLALEMGNVNGGEKIGINQSISTNERFTIPASAGMTYKVTFDVETFAGSVSRTKATKTIELKGYEFGVGNAYNLVATINKDNADENPMYDIVFDVVVDEWAEQDDEQLTFYDPDTKTATINTIEDLEYINESIYNQTIPSDIKIFLSNDIDLNDYYITRSGEPTASNWTPIGTEENPFKGTFDGNGHTIKNLALVEAEAKEGKAYIGFFGYAENATIKNVTFENVYINIPCLDIDHSQGHIGAVAGSLEGTSTIENVTVKGDIDIYTTQEANGASRVAVVAGGNAYGNVTMKNVHVIANAGSRLVANNNVGALAGQLQGKMVFENCSSNINVTANKFFAGGLVGIAAGDSYIKNCHTTGDIAVVAGREGRHNDEYRVGGIAGGWADGKTKVCTLTNCSYTGNVSGMNSDGAVAEPLDYMGYVGRGYTLSNCEGSKVIIDNLCFVQVGNAAPYGNYNITTADGNAVTKIYTAEELNNLKATNAYVVLMADIDFGGASMTKPIELWKDSTFDGMGHKISNVTTAVQGSYATSLFRGDANPGNKVVKNLVIENLSTPAGYSYAAAIWSDLQGANIEIDNVCINNSKIQAKGTIGGFVGFVSGSTTSVVIKNSSINNTNLNGGEADHKRGAVVGRAYGCVVNCENVVVENVEINDVAATEATLVGDKGYTGTVTVK